MGIKVAGYFCAGFGLPFGGALGAARGGRGPLLTAPHHSLTAFVFLLAATALVGGNIASRVGLRNYQPPHGTVSVCAYV